ncbi:DciA family protein [Streptomyces cucumeris]|uniref:DciA family protein n=1 Tax=Streptomyces cucumeris TaxID=2962890 RepID=UPI003D72FCB0
MDLARLAFRWAQEDARRGRFQPTSRPRPTPRGQRSKPESIPLCTAIDELITHKTGLSSTATALITQWPSIVGREVARRVVAVGFDQDTGTLMLRPASEAWASQIRLLAPQLIQRLNTELGSDTVRGIRTLSPRPLPPVASPRSPTKPYHRPASSARHPLDPAVLAVVERQAQQSAREPEDLLRGPGSTPASPTDRTRTRALRRAQARHEPRE